MVEGDLPGKRVVQGFVCLSRLSWVYLVRRGSSSEEWKNVARHLVGMETRTEVFCDKDVDQHEAEVQSLV